MTIWILFINIFSRRYIFCWRTDFFMLWKFFFRWPWWF